MSEIEGILAEVIDDVVEGSVFFCLGDSER